MRTRLDSSGVSATTRFLFLIVLCGLLLAAGCGPSDAELKASAQAEQVRTAIRRVFDLDAALGRARDQAAGDGQDLARSASAMRQYVAAASAIDLKDVPDDVRLAYTRHLDSWQAAAVVFDRYAGVTGAFRHGFDGQEYVSGQANSVQKATVDTWADLKAKAKAYGVEPPAK